MLIASFFTIAKICKQPKCPSVSRWVDKKAVAHLHGGILFNYKKEGNVIFHSSMDRPGKYYAKWKKSSRGIQIPYKCTYM